MERPKKDVSREFIPDDIRLILDRFRDTGFDVWLVGGALRDFLWGRLPKDWDLATSATPQQVIALFPRVIPIGLRHGTVQIHTGQENIEVTSCPAIGLEGLLADLRRRDFTVNAIALSYPEGQLIDPFDGQGDLLSQTLRAVGDARSRFREDPLRTLRAGRFMSIYGFHVAPETFEALREAAPGLDKVARERTREELFKMILGEYFIDAFGEMVRGGVIERILPELVGSVNSTDLHSDEAQVLERTVHRVQNSPPRLRVRLAALFYNLIELKGPERLQERSGDQSRFRECALAAAEIMRRLRASRRQEKEIASLLENQVPDGIEDWTEVEVRRFIARVGMDLLNDVLDLAYADRLARSKGTKDLRGLQSLQLKIRKELERKPALRIQDLAIDGRDVMRVLSLKPGPAVGEALQTLHQEVMKNPDLNKANILIHFLRREYNIKFKSACETGRVKSRPREDKDAG